MTSRILASVAAACLVLAFALAMLLPPDLSLLQLAAMVDHAALVAAQDAVRGRVSTWVWEQMMLPVLERPSWMVPAELGIVFVGLAATTSRRHGAPRSRRRRS